MNTRLIINENRSMLTAILLILILMFSISCSTFITKEEKKSLKSYEGQYVLLTDVAKGDMIIKKGEKVRVKVIATDDYIKIYAMPISIDIVKGEWVLILYMFADDFEKEKFDNNIFENRLYQVVKPVN